MRMITRCALALCAATMLSGDLTAQRSEARGQDTAAEAGRAARGATEQAETVKRGAATRREAAAHTGKNIRHAAAAEHRTLAREIATAETAHRGRLAKLRRLKILAEKEGLSGRLKEIEALRLRAAKNHEQQLSTLRERLDKDGKAAMERAVGMGRKVAAKTPAERRRALEMWAKEHPGRPLGVARRAHGKAGAAADKGLRGAAEALRGHNGRVPTAAERKAATERERAQLRARGEAVRGHDGQGNQRGGGRDG